MKAQILLWMVSSSLMLGCASVPRPDTNIGVVNAPNHYLRYFNMRTDFDDNGNLLSTAIPKYTTVNKLDDLNKYICLDPDSFANLKAYLIQLRNKANGTK